MFQFKHSSVVLGAVLLALAAPFTPAAAVTIGLPPPPPAGSCAAVALGGCTQAPSAFPIAVDGLFTGDEWSDVGPRAFISPSATSGSLTPVEVGNPDANSFLYAAVAPGELTGADLNDLYLGYSYHPRTDQVFVDGEFIADIAFPIIAPAMPGLGAGGSGLLTVEIRGADSTTGTGVNTTGGRRADSFFDVFLEFTPDSGGASAYVADLALPVSADVGFGWTGDLASDHLIIELEVGILNPGGNGTPTTAGGAGVGGPGGIYSPAPAFWSAGIANNLVDPPATAAGFSINPSTGATFLQTPEPATLWLVSLGLLALGARRRRAAGAGRAA